MYMISVLLQKKKRLKIPHEIPHGILQEPVDYKKKHTYKVTPHVFFMWECLKRGVPQNFLFSKKKGLGHPYRHPYFETSPMYISWNTFERKNPKTGSQVNLCIAQMFCTSTAIGFQKSFYDLRCVFNSTFITLTKRRPSTWEPRQHRHKHHG